VRHHTDFGIFYGMSTGTCFYAAFMSSSSNHPPNKKWKIREKFDGLRDGYVYTSRNGITGYYKDEKVKEISLLEWETRPLIVRGNSFEGPYETIDAFVEGHYSLLRLLATCKEAYEEQIGNGDGPFYEQWSKQVLQYLKSPERNVEVLYPGWWCWIDVNHLPSVVELKVVRFHQPGLWKEFIVLPSNASFGDLMRSVERRFEIDPGTYDLKFQTINLDLSNADARISLQNKTALTLQYKEFSGQVKYRRGVLETKELPPTRLMTLSDLRKSHPTNRKRKNGTMEGTDEDENDEDEDDDDEEYVPPPTTSKDRSMRRINAAFDSRSISPFHEILEDGQVKVGFSLAMPEAESRTYWGDLFTVGCVQRLDKKVKEDKRQQRTLDNRRR